MFIHLLIEDHLDCFHLLTFENSAVMSICIQGAVCAPALNSFRYTPKSEITESYDNSV